MAVCIGGKNRIRRVQYRVTENVEVRTMRSGRAAYVYIHLVGRDAPIRRARLGSASRKLAVQYRVALARRLVHLGTLHAQGFVVIGNRSVGQIARLFGQIYTSLARLDFSQRIN